MNPTTDTPTVDRRGLESLRAEIEQSDGRDLAEILKGYTPKAATIGGKPLVPLSAGHELVLAQLDHPLASKEPARWGPSDVAVALFVFTKPASELLRLIDQETFERKLYEFLDQVPTSEISASATMLLAHWLRGRVAKLNAA